MEIGSFPGGSPTLCIYGTDGHLGVDLFEFIDERHLENRMTVRKGIPRLGKHCKEPASGHFVQRSLRDKLSRSCGERANAGTRRRNGAGNLFGGTATESKMEGTHER